MGENIYQKSLFSNFDLKKKQNFAFFALSSDRKVETLVIFLSLTLEDILVNISKTYNMFFSQDF